jgi:hypothetical protein
MENEERTTGEITGTGVDSLSFLGPIEGGEKYPGPETPILEPCGGCSGGAEPLKPYNPKPYNPNPEDNWIHRADNMRCKTCMFYVRKVATVISTMYPPPDVGRCRALPPTMKGWPVVFGSDWCGGHKLDENKV